MKTSKYITEATDLPTFYQFPHFLMEQPISYTAKIVYMVLYDRMRLSQKNGWIQDGRVYEHFPITEIAQTVHRSMTSVKTALNELESNGLLERESAGFSKPNQLFILIPEEAAILSTMEPEKSPSDGQFSDHTAVSFPATSKVIDSSNISQNNSIKIANGKYRNVFLSAQEYAELQKEIPDRLDDLIESMSVYLESHGRKYSNYAAALRTWVARNKQSAKDRKDMYRTDIKFEEGTSL